MLRLVRSWVRSKLRRLSVSPVGARTTGAALLCAAFVLAGSAAVGATSGLAKVDQAPAPECAATKIGCAYTPTEAAPVPRDETGAGFFGAGVAVSANGNTILIGASNDSPTSTDINGPPTGAGAAWIFVRQGTGWTQQGSKLTGSDGFFGAEDALSCDGNTAFVGDAGSIVDVFDRTGSVWARTGRIDISRAPFNSNVVPGGLSVSCDGRTLALGNNIYTRSGANWQHEATLTVPLLNPVAASFNTVTDSLSGDGSTLLIGEPSANQGLATANFVLVFRRSQAGWTQEARLQPSDSALDPSGFFKGNGFGEALAISNDGSTALIGAPFDSGIGQNVLPGAAWIFTRTASGWTQTGTKLTAMQGDCCGGEWAQSVALTPDGTHAFVVGSGTSTGFAFVTVFKGSATGWSRLGSTPAVRGLGIGSLATSADGATLLAGDAVAHNSVGAAQLFEPTPIRVQSVKAALSKNKTLVRTARQGLLQNAVGFALTISKHTMPRHGMLRVSPNGAYTYRPTRGFHGRDSFTVTIRDGNGRTTTLRVAITVA